jgi:HlyD family secretion protein
MDTEIAMRGTPASPEPTKKRAIRNAIILLIACLILLTLFSNTLLNYSLPQVTVAKPDAGALVQSVVGSGTVEAAETADSYMEVNWTVASVAVKAGDKVAADQTLVSFNTADAEANLKDEQARAEQRRINVSKLENSFIDANKAGDEKNIRSLELDLRNARLDVQIEDHKVQQLEQQLQKNKEIKAPFDGMVVEVNAVKDKPVPNGTAAVKVADTSKGQLAKANIEPSKAEYVKVGDTVDLLFASLNNTFIKATISEINSVKVAQTDKKELVFAIKDARLKGGESASFTIFKRMPPSRSLLPSGAVRSDEQSSYVLVVKEKKGVLGNEFYVQRANVQVGNSDDTHTEIVNGLGPLDKVVASGNKPVSDGDRVMIQ